MICATKSGVLLKELIVKTVFLSSDEEPELEEFINEFVDICVDYNMSFKDICEIFENIAMSLSENNPPV